MANVQIYQLDGVSSNLDNSALLACDITNPDASERATTPKVTRKLSVAELESQVLKEEEYTTELNTTNQTIFGAINEQQSVIGYSYDAYDDTATYSVGDLCIYNNTLYKALQATTGNLPTNTTYWEPTSIADEIGRIDTALSGKQDTIKYVTGSVTLEANSYVSPFTYYKEVDLTSTLATKTVIGIVGKTTTTNPITFNYNTNGNLRIYGSKADVVEFRVSYI